MVNGFCMIIELENSYPIITKCTINNVANINCNLVMNTTACKCVSGKNHDKDGLLGNNIYILRFYIYIYIYIYKSLLTDTFIIPYCIHINIWFTNTVYLNVCIVCCNDSSHIHTPRSFCITSDDLPLTSSIITEYKNQQDTKTTQVIFISFSRCSTQRA